VFVLMLLNKVSKRSLLDIKITMLYMLVLKWLKSQEGRDELAS